MQYTQARTSDPSESCTTFLFFGFLFIHLAIVKNHFPPIEMMKKKHLWYFLWKQFPGWFVAKILKKRKTVRTFPFNMWIVNFKTRRKEKSIEDLLEIQRNAISKLKNIFHSKNISFEHCIKEQRVLPYHNHNPYDVHISHLFRISTTTGCFCLIFQLKRNIEKIHIDYTITIYEKLYRFVIAQERETEFNEHWTLNMLKVEM